MRILIAGATGADRPALGSLPESEPADGLWSLVSAASRRHARCQPLGQAAGRGTQRTELGQADPDGDAEMVDAASALALAVACIRIRSRKRRWRSALDMAFPVGRCPISGSSNRSLLLPGDDVVSAEDRLSLRRPSGTPTITRWPRLSRS
jgi:hypothetical protein